MDRTERENVARIVRRAADLGRDHEAAEQGAAYANRYSGLRALKLVAQGEQSMAAWRYKELVRWAVEELDFTPPRSEGEPELGDAPVDWHTRLAWARDFLDGAGWCLEEVAEYAPPDLDRKAVDKINTRVGFALEGVRDLLTRISNGNGGAT